VFLKQCGNKNGFQAPLNTLPFSLNLLKEFCMTTTLSFDESVTLLKKVVKYSEVKNQKHIDLSLCTADERPLCQKALVIVNLEVEKGTLTEAQLKTKLGLD
jgi:hypothetical protein